MTQLKFIEAYRVNDETGTVPSRRHKITVIRELCAIDAGGGVRRLVSASRSLTLAFSSNSRLNEAELPGARRLPTSPTLAEPFLCTSTN